MPRTTKPPSYRKHKPTGQAVVTIDGKDFYLGKHGTRASRQEHDRLISEWLAGGRTLQSTNQTQTVNELLAAYLRFAKTYYRKDGKQTSELWLIKRAMKPLKQIYGQLPADKFSPLKLKAIRQGFIDEGHGRKYINENVGRIKRIFKWGVENEIVPASVYHGLQAISGLRRGRTTAPEGKKVRPVADSFIDTVEPFVLPPVWTMIQLQRLTGMRGGEVVIMRGCDLDTDGKIWLYHPTSHKSEHYGYERVIDLGPRAQKIIEPFLRSDTQAYLFSPSDAMDEHRKERRRNRKTPVQPSQAKRRRKRTPKRTPKDCYTVDSYRRSIHRACEQAEVPMWSPHRLRHNFATMIRKQYGIETARILLGHRSAFTTEIYAQADRMKARDVMAKIG